MVCGSTMKVLAVGEEVSKFKNQNSKSGAAKVRQVDSALRGSTHPVCGTS